MMPSMRSRMLMRKNVDNDVRKDSRIYGSNPYIEPSCSFKELLKWYFCDVQNVPLCPRKLSIRLEFTEVDKQRSI